MINYVEKGIGLVELLSENGVQVINGQVKHSPLTDEETQALIDNYDPLPLSRQSALERINEQSQNYINSQLEEYPEFERQTWELQRQEALNYQNNPLAETPTINAIASARGIDRVTLINRIITNNVNWRDLAAHVAGIRQGLLDRAWAETDYRIIDQINFEI